MTLTQQVGPTYEFTLIVTGDLGAPSEPDTVTVTVSPKSAGSGGGGNGGGPKQATP